VTKAIDHVGPLPNANHATTTIATEKAAAMQTENAAAKHATATGVSAMCVATGIGRVMRIVPAMRTARAAPTSREMRTGRAVRIAPAAQIGRAAQIDPAGPSLHVGRLDRWAAREIATSAHCSAGSTPTATTCLTGASLPNYRNLSTVAGRDHRAARLARASVVAVLTGHSAAAPTALKCAFANADASTVHHAAMVLVRESATSAAHAATNGVAAPTAPIMHPTGPDRRKPARTRPKPFEAP
jgi:hypothetical protein